MSAAGAGAGSGAGSGRPKAKPKTLPRWKRLSRDSTLYSLALQAIAIAPGECLKSWPKDVEVENRRFMSGRRERRRDDATVKRDILAACLKAGTMGDTFPLQFFRPDTETLILNSGPTLDNVLCQKIATRCTKLLSLDISSCFNILDENITAILKGCPDLSAITVRGCRMLTDVSMTSMCDSGLRLREVDVGGCFNLTVDGVYHLVSSHPNRASFSKLDLSGTPLSDKIMQTIGAECVGLAELGIGYCQVGDDVFKELMGKLPRIQRLKIHWCPRLSAVAVNFLGDRCQQLEYVDMQGCRSISSNAISAFIASRSPSRRDPELLDRKLLYLNCKFCTSLNFTLLKRIKSDYPDLKLVHT